MATVTIQSFPSIQEFLDMLKAKWDAENPKVSTWLSVPYGYFKKAAKFVLDNLDEAIHLVESLTNVGPDKKALVLDLAGKLFDYIVAQAFPVYLKPFVPVFRKILLDVLVSNLIDFIVGKYNQGVWAK